MDTTGHQAFLVDQSNERIVLNTECKGGIYDIEFNITWVAEYLKRKNTAVSKSLAQKINTGHQSVERYF